MTSRLPSLSPTRESKPGIHDSARVVLYQKGGLDPAALTVHARKDVVVAGIAVAWASPSKLKPYVKLSRTLRGDRDGILSAIRLGLFNGRMEGLNSKVWLLAHRSFGAPAA